jgi:4-hydroxy-3-polyprenylbenzoate decarboxylase
MAEVKHLIIGASGASGMPVLKRCLEITGRKEEWRTTLVMSESAIRTMPSEGIDVNEVRALADEVKDEADIGAWIASGSQLCEGMLVVPCSMKSAAGIANGYTDNLLLRAADVTIKEKRPLVLGVRETPLSQIHLRNLLTLAEISTVTVLPLMMTFYNQPQTIDDMVTSLAARLLRPFGITCEDYRPWQGN